MKVNPNKFGYTQVKEPKINAEKQKRKNSTKGFINCYNSTMSCNSMQYAINYRKANQIVDKLIKDRPKTKTTKYCFADRLANLLPQFGGEVSDKGMRPTLDVGWDIKGKRCKQQYERYSVVFCVAYNSKKGYNEMSLKRVIGLPGETVSLHEDGHVSINDKILDEPYIKKYHKRSVGVGNYHLGKNEYFILGDNRDFGFDSSSYGPVKRRQIKHMITLVLKPDSSVFENIGKLSGF